MIYDLRFFFLLLQTFEGSVFALCTGGSGIISWSYSHVVCVNQKHMSGTRCFLVQQQNYKEMALSILLVYFIQNEVNSIWNDLKTIKDYLYQN